MTTKMKTKFLMTITNPDDIDAENFEDKLECCDRFTSERAAKKAFKSFAKHTNADVYLLKVELVAQADGTIFDDEVEMTEDE